MSGDIFFALPFWYQLVLTVALGAIWGSFVTALCSRWLRGESVADGRSHCDACQATLRTADLMPLLSYVLLRGKCRYCFAPIGREAVYIELVSVIIGLVAIWAVPDGQMAVAAIFGWLMLPLAILDYEKLWLPNRLVLILAIMGIFLGPYLSLDLIFRDQALGGVFGYLSLEIIRRAFLMLRHQEGMGAGDTKLFGAIGIWLGWELLPFTLLFSCVVGFAYILLRRAPGKLTTVQLPFGAFLCIAAFMTSAFTQQNFLP